MWLSLLWRISAAVARAEWTWRTGKVSGFRLQVLCYAAQQVLDAERAAHIAQIQRAAGVIEQAARRTP